MLFVFFAVSSSSAHSDNTSLTFKPCGLRRVEDITNASTFRNNTTTIFSIPGLDYRNRANRFHLSSTLQSAFISYKNPADINTSVIEVRSLSDGTLKNSFIAQNSPSKSDFALDPSNMVWVPGLASEPNVLRKYDSQGSLKRTITFSGELGGKSPTVTGAFFFNDGKNDRIGVLIDTRDTVVLNLNGDQIDTLPWQGDRVTQSRATGNIFINQNGRLYIFDRTGKTPQLSGLGGDPTDSKSKTGFSGLTNGDQINTGEFFTLDTLGITKFNKDGVIIGRAKNDVDDAGGHLGFVTGSPLEIYNGSAYYLKEGSSLTKIDLSRLNAITESGQLFPFTLGVGAAIVTNQTAAELELYKENDSISMGVEFSPWWNSLSTQVTGSYIVRTIDDIRDNKNGKENTFTIPANITSKATVPFILPPSQTGFYEVDVKLYRNGTEVIGASCADYAVLNPKSTFNPANLSTGSERTVKLAKALGQRMVRLNVDFSSLLTSPDSTEPLNFMKTDATFKAAAEAGRENRITIEVQITGGDFEKAMIKNGSYETRLLELIEHYKNDITYWEAWNEPNNTYDGGNGGARFLEEVLKPLYRSAKKVSGNIKVIAGGFIGIPTNGYIKNILDAGGVSFFDAIAVHPYTGHNRSVEEQNSKAGLVELRTLLDQRGRADAEIWDTESGFWAEGPASYFTQGDKLIRKHLLQDSLGITKHHNFYNEGGYQVDGLYWSLVNPGGFKPGAMASENWSRIIGEGSFEKFIPSDIPHAFAAQYIHTQATPNTVVVWTEDFKTEISVTFSQDTEFTVTDEWGREKAIRTVGKNAVLPISGMPNYINFPSGVTVTKLQPALSFGNNLARSLKNVSVTASSTGTYSKNGSNPMSFPPSRVIDGVMDMQGYGNINQAPNGGASVWFQSESDANPWIQLTLPAPATINRVLVSSQGIFSVTSGLKSYTVELQTPSGWKKVAEATNEFFDRNHLHTFTPVEKVTAVRIANMVANNSGYFGGLKTLTSVGDYRTMIYEVELYGSTVATVPTVSPTIAPTATPTVVATPMPLVPTSTPTTAPTTAPTKIPTANPTATKTALGTPTKPATAGATPIKTSIATVTPRPTVASNPLNECSAYSNEVPRSRLAIDIRNLKTRIGKVKKLLVPAKKNSSKYNLVKKLSAISNQLTQTVELTKKVVPRSSVVCQKFDALRCVRQTLNIQVISLKASYKEQVVLLLKTYEETRKIFSSRSRQQLLILNKESAYVRNYLKKGPEVFEEFVTVDDRCP